jgi:hypothetical protein
MYCFFQRIHASGASATQLSSTWDLVDLAEFAKTVSPRGPIVLPSVGNRMPAFAHDDGRRLSLFYADWEPVRAPMHSLAGGLTNTSFDAFDRPWESEAIRVTATDVHSCPGTIDIDGLMNEWDAAEGHPPHLLHRAGGGEAGFCAESVVGGGVCCLLNWVVPVGIFHGRIMLWW